EVAGEEHRVLLALDREQLRDELTGVNAALGEQVTTAFVHTQGLVASLGARRPDLCGTDTALEVHLLTGYEAFGALMHRDVAAIFVDSTDAAGMTLAIDSDVEGRHEK